MEPSEKPAASVGVPAVEEEEHAQDPFLKMLVATTQTAQQTPKVARRCCCPGFRDGRGAYKQLDRSTAGGATHGWRSDVEASRKKRAHAQMSPEDGAAMAAPNAESQPSALRYLTGGRRGLRQTTTKLIFRLVGRRCQSLRPLSLV